MNYDSVLNGSAMAGQCREMASRLKQEIDFYSFEISAINTFIESKASGEAATALKNKAEKLIQMLQIVISANEYDIRDCNILAEMVDGITIDGYEVLTRKQEARNNAEECYNQAAYYSRVASECIISSIGNHFYELANTYRGYAVSWERIEDALHKIENQYDDIDYDSSILFKDGYDTRCLLDNEEYDVVLLDCPMPTGVIKGGNTKPEDSDIEEVSIDELTTKYFFLFDYLKNKMGLSESTAKDILKKLAEENYLGSFWATYNYDTAGYDKLLYELELKVKYSFLYEHLQNTTGLSESEALDVLKELADKNRLGSFWATYNYSQNDYNILLKNLDIVVFEKKLFKEWVNITDASISDLNMYLEKYNITNFASIQNFLIVCMHESGRGKWTVELADGGTSYDYNDKGVGYIQVTHRKTQLAFLKYVGDGYSGENTAGYINENYSPWEVSVWYWKTYVDANSMFEQYGNNPNSFLYASYKVNGFPTSQEDFRVSLLVENKEWRYDQLTDEIVIDEATRYPAPNGWKDRWDCYQLMFNNL